MSRSPDKTPAAITFYLKEKPDGGVEANQAEVLTREQAETEVRERERERQQKIIDEIIRRTNRQN